MMRSRLAQCPPVDFSHLFREIFNQRIIINVSMKTACVRKFIKTFIHTRCACISIIPFFVPEEAKFIQSTSAVPGDEYALETH